MFASIILEVYYMKNKKSGKKSENLIVQKNFSSLGTRPRDACTAVIRVNH